MDKDARKRNASRLHAQDAARREPPAASAPDGQQPPSGEAAAGAAGGTPTTTNAAHPARTLHLDLTGLLARLRATSPISRLATASSAITLPEIITRPGKALNHRLRSRRRSTRKDRLQDWQNWSKFRLWRRTRPLWGSLLMMIAGAIMIFDAVFFLSLAFLAQSLWPAILVGGLLLVMGLIALFLPSYAVITGSIGMVLSLVSLLVASFGGCGVGMLLGIIGSALCIAWRPVKRSRLVAAGSSRTR